MKLTLYVVVLTGLLALAAAKRRPFGGKPFGFKPAGSRPQKPVVDENDPLRVCMETCVKPVPTDEQMTVSSTCRETNCTRPARATPEERAVFRQCFRDCKEDTGADSMEDMIACAQSCSSDEMNAYKECARACKPWNEEMAAYD